MTLLAIPRIDAASLTPIKLWSRRIPTMGSTPRSAMPFFRISRLKRHFASAMLVFWVLALGAAWANACLLQDRTKHIDPSFVATDALPAVSPDHADVMDIHAQGQSPAEAPCLKICDDVSQSLVKWQPGMELPATAMFPSSAMAWPESVAALDAWQSVGFVRPAHSDLPLRTRYLRLTL